MENSTVGGVAGTAGTYSNRWQNQAAFRDRGSLHRLCALAADDEADSREAIALLLRWCGYDVKLAADGEQALEIAQQYRPELIFLDIGMPGLDGYEVCRRLRRTPEFAHARIIAMSGYSGATHDRRCTEAGFTAQMPKPIDPSALERFAEP
jgi:CheY-like chemotaxis protein